MNKKKVAIIYDEYDAKTFNENKINVDCIKVLTPNAYVKLNKYNKNILIKANQIINDKKHKEILIKTDQILKKIIFNLKYSSLLSSCKQTIIDRLSVIIPTYIYLNYFFNLKEITLVVNNNKITECKDSLSFFNLLHKKIHNFIINFVSIIINYFFLFTNKKKKRCLDK